MTASSGTEAHKPLYHFEEASPYGRRDYPGNCGGNLIRDLRLYFQPGRVSDPMTGSGRCADVFRGLGIPCDTGDLHSGADACAHGAIPAQAYDFCWIHSPY